MQGALHLQKEHASRQQNAHDSTCAVCFKGTVPMLLEAESGS